MSNTAFTALQTERLILRRFEDNDLVPFLAYLNDPLVAKYQTWNTYTEQRAREVIEEQKTVSPGIPGSPFLFAVELRNEQSLAGHVVLTVQEKDQLQAEIGFTFARQFHGRGLAKEAASRVLEYVFSELKLHRVIAITDCENLSSTALLARLGMRREGHYIQNIWFKGKWGDEYLYAILRDEWRHSTDT
jgi:RimJ/RimL family protein N-acetyltransferase